MQIILLYTSKLRCFRPMLTAVVGIHVKFSTHPRENGKSSLSNINILEKSEFSVGISV